MRPIGWRFVIMILCVSCQLDNPISIGYLGGLTGSASELGTQGRKSLEMIVQQVNQRGGIRGRQVRLVVQDDLNDPAAALAAYQVFEQQKVVAVIGPMASATMRDALPYLNSHQILTISPTVSSADLTGQDDWFYRVISSNLQFGSLLGRFSLSQGCLQVGVVRETSNNAYTRGILQTFRQSVESAGGRVLWQTEFDMRKKPDYAALIPAQRLARPQAVLVLSNGYDAAQIGQRLALQGWDQLVLCPPWAMTKELIELGGRQAQRMILASLYDTECREPGYLEFAKQYRQLYGEDVGFPAIYTSDAWTALRAALEASSDWSPAGLKTALSKFGNLQGLQSLFHFDRFGDVQRPLSLATVREGRFVRADS